MTYWLIVITRKRIGVMGRSTTAKNGYEHLRMVSGAIAINVKGLLTKTAT
jgi:hypothetical protein